MTSPPEGSRFRAPTTGRWRNWARVLVIAELLLVAALFLRQGLDPVPALGDLQRVSAPLAGVIQTCLPGNAGPLTVSICRVELEFDGPAGRVRSAYASRSMADAAPMLAALLPLRGRTVDVWLLSPEDGVGPPEIWQLTHGGETILAYADVAAYHGGPDRRGGLVIGIPLCLICLAGVFRALGRGRSLRRMPGQDAVAPAAARAERALDAMMSLALLWAIFLCLRGEVGFAIVVVMVCGVLSVFYWRPRG